MADASALLADVKLYLDITWSDQGTDDKISALIANGQDYIVRKVGGSIDFATNRLANQLLKDYVRYARDSALDVFENNYKNMIMALQTERQVDVNVATT